MKLYSNPASPFARKVRVVAHELGLKLDIIDIKPLETPEHRRINPLGKIPALVLDDGSVLIDSPVICEYLNQLGGGKFFPGQSIWRNSSGRWKAQSLQALADGMMEAAVARQYEMGQPSQNQTFVARYEAAVVGGLDALERMRFADPPTIGEIATGCALGYLDFRWPALGWRDTRPKLAAWYETFAQFASMQATVPQ